LGWLQKIFLLFSLFGSASIPPVHSSPRFTPPLSSWRTQKTCRIPVTPKFYNLSFASWAPLFFRFFLSWVSKTQPNHWTKRMASTLLAT
jgi:hypothetical protein